ncbi:MAG TPA: DUF465 domain-containing protein [Hyphomonas sp.]|nr:DUF465 domain-containing protein [Hyphomonas sp.]HRX73013.1 DUF465 domain-containing protein [Hyphomonas sp.]
MNSRYIDALVRRHASIQKMIEDAQSAPSPDALLIMRLNKVRLAYRERMKKAITEKRIEITRDQRSRFPKASARLAREFTPQPNAET